jgi:folate-binding protein YgfZ
MIGALSNRAVLSLVGADASSFLQGLITQDVSREETTFAALLTPQGKILFDFFLFPRTDGFFIDCEVSAAPALLKRLSIYKLRAKITLSEESLLAVALGEGAPDPRHAGLPARAIVERGESSPIDAAYDGLRLSLGAPEFGKDFGGEEVFLLDVNYDALNAVSYAKGCFVGQEVTSRMKRKGEIRKRTLIARFDGAAPQKGTKVTAGGEPIGEILSGGDGVALALIRIDRLREAETQGAALSAGGRMLKLTFPPYLERR